MNGALFQASEHARYLNSVSEIASATASATHALVNARCNSLSILRASIVAKRVSTSSISVGDASDVKRRANHSCTVTSLRHCASLSSSVALVVDVDTCACVDFIEIVVRGACSATSSSIIVIGGSSTTSTRGGIRCRGAASLGSAHRLRLGRCRFTDGALPLLCPLFQAVRFVFGVVGFVDVGASSFITLTLAAGSVIIGGGGGGCGDACGGGADGGCGE